MYAGGLGVGCSRAQMLSRANAARKFEILREKRELDGELRPPPQMERSGDSAVHSNAGSEDSCFWSVGSLSFESYIENPVLVRFERLANEGSMMLCSVSDWCHRIVTDSWFQKFIICLILVNSVMIGITTIDVVRESPETMEIFDSADMTVLVIFTIELVFNLFAFGPRGFVKDYWLIFDLFLVVFSWVGPQLYNVTMIRSFRIFRTLRLFSKCLPGTCLVL